MTEEVVEREWQGRHLEDQDRVMLREMQLPT